MTWSMGGRKLDLSQVFRRKDDPEEARRRDAERSARAAEREAQRTPKRRTAKELAALQRRRDAWGFSRSSKPPAPKETSTTLAQDPEPDLQESAQDFADDKIDKQLSKEENNDENFSRNTNSFNPDTLSNNTDSFNPLSNNDVDNSVNDSPMGSVFTGPQNITGNNLNDGSKIDARDFSINLGGTATVNGGGVGGYGESGDGKPVGNLDINTPSDYSSSFQVCRPKSKYGVEQQFATLIKLQTMLIARL